MGLLMNNKISISEFLLVLIGALRLIMNNLDPMVAQCGTICALTIRTLGASFVVLNIPTGFPDWTSIIVEVDMEKINRRLRDKYLDTYTKNIDEAIKSGKPTSIAVLGNAATVYQELQDKGIIPDIVSDQTAAHDINLGYVPEGYTIDNFQKFREENPNDFKKKVYETIVKQVKSMLYFQSRGASVFDYGNDIRTRAKEGGLENAFDILGYVPAYIRDLFAIGSGPFRWLALSGNPEDIRKIDDAILKNMDDKHLTDWIKLAGEYVHFQGLPARICYASYGEREKITSMPIHFLPL